jgi:hypothetical protein
MLPRSLTYAEYKTVDRAVDCHDSVNKGGKHGRGLIIGLVISYYITHKRDNPKTEVDQGVYEKEADLTTDLITCYIVRVDILPPRVNDLERVNGS